MVVEKDELAKFFDEDEIRYPFSFPVVLKTDRNLTNSKRAALRRNVSIHSAQYRKSDARLVSKRGRAKTYAIKIPRKSIRYVKDLWNTLVTTQWRWLLFIVALVNLLAYLVCTMLFYYDSWFSGDFGDNSDNLACMKGTQNIRQFFLLGIETITTTGYGYVHPTENCKLFYVVLTFSTIISIVIDGAFISVVYVKLNRTKDQTPSRHIFSKKCVIAMRNGMLCLIVRLNDHEGKHWINSNINLYLVKESRTKEGVIMPHFVTELDIASFGMMFWPLDIVHEIDAKSPLWEMSAKDLMTTKMEIVIVVTGSSVKTGQSTKSQTSYLHKEVMWGYQFAPCLEYHAAKGKYVVNERAFNRTVPQEMPLCSAKVLATLQNRVKTQRRSLDLSFSNMDSSKYIFKYNEN